MLRASPDDVRAARFTAVATAVWEPLYRYLRRRAAQADVDDVAAEVLAVLWARLDDVPAGAELPWTYAVARRCLANHRRSDVRRHRLADRLRARDGRGTASADPADLVAASDPALQLALATLSSDDRELLTLWAWEELGVGELAAALGIAPNTVSVRLRRARQRLAAQLAPAPPAAAPATCHIGAGAGHTGGGRTAHHVDVPVDQEQIP